MRMLVDPSISVVALLSLSSIVSASFVSLPLNAQSLPLNPAAESSLELEATSTPSESLYRLGAGDQIQIDIFDVPEFSGEEGTYQIPVDGKLNLPWIGQVSVQGLTLTQAEQVLSARYAPYINNPLITLTLLTPRSLRVAVVGEVNRPGPYTLTPGEGGDLPVSADLVELGGSANNWPTITQAIQVAGGITQSADVRNIQVQRITNAQPEVIDINMWEFLQAGDLSQDVTLRDGDTIVIPKAVALSAEELTQLATANFSPDIITVNVVGQVNEPGTIEVPPNTSLNQAILAAGGFTPDRARKRVELIRLNPDGTISRSELRVDLDNALNSDLNPALRNNDIVVVRRSTLARIDDALNIVLPRTAGILGILDIFNFFDGDDDDDDDDDIDIPDSSPPQTDSSP